jgi:hypothetical protein
MTTPSIKMAVFMDKVAELMVLSMKRDVFMDERIAQKETPSKGCLFLLDTLAAGTTFS